MFYVLLEVVLVNRLDAYYNKVKEEVSLLWRKPLMNCR